MIRNVCFSCIDVVVDSRVIPVSCSLIKTSCWRGFVAVTGFDLSKLGGFKGPLHPNSKTYILVVVLVWLCVQHSTFSSRVSPPNQCPISSQSFLQMPFVQSSSPVSAFKVDSSKSWMSPAKTESASLLYRKPKAHSVPQQKST